MRLRSNTNARRADVCSPEISGISLGQRGQLTDQVAWISGATSGIGAATARLFAREGAKVVVVGRRGALARQIAADINRAGGAALAVHCDVGKEAQVRDSMQKAIAHFGALHILVNNAGMVDVKPLHEYTDRAWDQVMNVNVKSMFFAVKHALSHLRRHPRSYIVNIGSISSLVGQALTPVYTASKHAVLGLTKSIALDYAVDGIRCNCVCPGITDTPMLREHLDIQPDPDAALAARLQRVPMGVILRPEDVAQSILYFSCEASSGITGTSLVVDGGYLTPAEWITHGKTAFMDKGHKAQTTEREGRRSENGAMTGKRLRAALMANNRKAAIR
jgi:NAD(P)-dependent dehydrogenase (short-subunit alcohol dehydrogenase family)